MTTYIRKSFSTLVTHKKKSVFFSVCAYFGFSYLRRRQRNSEIRSQYCQQAKKYGDQYIAPTDKPRRITVLVNRWAKDGKSRQGFEDNALPLLNLAGLEVNVVNTENAQQLQDMAAVLDKSDDAVYVVGGDGTISRLLTGIYQNGLTFRLPVGVFPGGRNNYSLKSLWSDSYRLPDVKWACESAMALISDVKRSANVFKITDEEGKATYCLSYFSWGPFAEIETLKWKYWYWNGWKTNFAYLWNSIKVQFLLYYDICEFFNRTTVFCDRLTNELEINNRKPGILDASVVYEYPCSGCNRCRKSQTKSNNNSEWRWWNFLVGAPRQNKTQEIDFSQIVNERCGQTDETTVETCDFVVENSQNGDPKLQLSVGPSTLSRKQFVSDGWNRSSTGNGFKSSSTFYNNEITAKRFTVSPGQLSERLQKFTADGDVYNLSGKFQVELVPEQVELFVAEKSVSEHVD